MEGLIDEVEEIFQNIEQDKNWKTENTKKLEDHPRGPIFKKLDFEKERQQQNRGQAIC